MSPPLRSLATIAALSAVGASAVGAAPLITLSEGGNISVSVSADSKRMVFDLIGSIWIMNPDDGRAELLTSIDEYNRHPAISPDGKRIAYESMRDGFQQIMLTDTDRGEARQLTFGEHHHMTPDWSADGRHIVMASDRAGAFDLWELDVDTLSLSQLTSGAHADRSPTWDAAGRTLAFVRDMDEGSAIMALRPGEPPRALLKESARMHAPAWRPGNRVLTYVREMEGRTQLRMLILSNPPITKPITYSERVHPYPARWIDERNFFYAADGRIKRRNFGESLAEAVPLAARIEVERNAFPMRKQAFDTLENRAVSGVTGLSPTGDGRLIVSALGDLWELNANGDLQRQLSNDAFVDTHPAVSPDGRTLAFISDRGGDLQLWLMDIESGDLRRLTTETGIVMYPAWSEGSDALIFLVADGATSDWLSLKRVEIDALEVTLLANRLPNSAPPLWDGDDWSAPSLEAPDSDQTRLPLTWRPLIPDGRFIIRAGRLFDGIGPGYLREQEIVIEGNRITEVRPWGQASAGERVIDASGLTVMPGLIDLSVQQTYVSGEQLGRDWLAAGVTTIRETIWNLPEATERYESWLSGRRLGPRLYLALNPCIRGQESMGMRAVEKVSEGLARSNVVLVELCPSLGNGADRMLIQAAHSAGVPVATPSPFPALLLGADELSFGPARSPGALTMLQPAGFSYADIADIAGALNTTIASRLGIAGGAAGPELSHALGRGARVVTGSAAPLTPYGSGLQDELRLLAEAGLQPFQVLKMASLDAARTLGAGDDLGSIRAGKLADLVIVDGDPLADIGDSANVVMTIINGHVYDRSDLSRAGARGGSVGKLYN